MIKNNFDTYYSYNGHGDVTTLTNSAGTVTKSYTYDAFGNEINKSDSDTNPWRYCGEYYDSETEEIYLRARYYSPPIGRFLSEDMHWNTNNMIYGDNVKDKTPLTPNMYAILQSINLYLYCINNPLRFIDFLGEIIKEDGGYNLDVTKQLLECTNEYNKAKANGDEEGMKEAETKANKIRNDNFKISEADSSNWDLIDDPLENLHMYVIITEAFNSADEKVASGELTKDSYEYGCYVTEIINNHIALYEITQSDSSYKDMMKSLNDDDFIGALSSLFN